MTNHERSESSQESSKPTRLRDFWSRIRRSSQTAAEPDVPSIVQDRSEDTDHGLHQERVGQLAMGVFNAVDARVAEWIDYDGNIREEIKDKLGPWRRGSGRHLDVKSLDPAVRPYVQSSIFNVRSGGEAGEPYARYTLDCQVGNCTPSFQLEMPDGSLEAKLYQGPNEDAFHTVHFRRIYDKERRVQELTTFTPNYRDSYLPAHPLAIARGWLGSTMPLCHVIYDNIDAGGNVVLLDGQSIQGGIYSAADRSITSIGYNQVPHTVEDDRFLVGYPGRNVAVPFETNLYDELRGITGSILGIEN